MRRKSCLGFIFAIIAAFELVKIYLQTKRVLTPIYLNERDPNVKIVHFVIPICQGEEEMYEIFMKHLKKIKKREWDFRVFVIYQMDNTSCFWPALINIGLKHSLIQGEANCIIPHSVYTLPQGGFDFGKCNQPTKICSNMKCFYHKNDDENIYYEAITASPADWKHIIEYKNQTKVNYVSLYNALQVIFKLKFLAGITESIYCKCINSLTYNMSYIQLKDPPYKFTVRHHNDSRKQILFIQSSSLDGWKSTWLKVGQLNIDQLKHRNAVSPKHKMIYFPNGKSGSTYWKCLLHFIEFNKPCPGRIHSRQLLTLQNYSESDALDMMFNETWTKFTIVREPRERILSAYLNMAVNTKRVQNVFCKKDVNSFSAFVDLIKICKNVHWRSQIYLPASFYNNMLIGRMGRKHNITTFMEALLVKVGAWETAKHWMVSSTHLESTKHPTNAKDKIEMYYNRSLERKIISMYKSEYKLFEFDDSFIT